MWARLQLTLSAPDTYKRNYNTRRLGATRRPQKSATQMRVEKLSHMGIQLRRFWHIHQGSKEIRHMGLTFLDFELHGHSRLQQLALHSHCVGQKKIARPAHEERWRKT